MANILTEHWSATKDALCDGLSGNRLHVMETVLENTRKQILRENATPGSTTSGNLAYVSNVIMPTLRRVMPTTIANEIVGVQAMTGPVGQIHTLRAVYSDTVPAGAPVPGQITMGSEALSHHDIARFYSGNQNPANPGAAVTSRLEGTPGNRISIQLLKETVEARSRKLQARWTPEAAQDADNVHGLDIEKEFMTILATHITAEIDQEILTSLRKLPGAPTDVFDQSLVSGTPNYVGDEFGALGLMVQKQANLIANRTRKPQGGNWMVVSNLALTMLQAATKSAFQSAVAGTFESPSNTRFVGTLNNSIKVYVDAYANDSTPILIGYKGQGEFDAAAYYCPYIPLMSNGVITDPNTYEQVMSFMTRYAYVELSNKANSFGNAADYLGLIGINANSIRFL